MDGLIHYTGPTLKSFLFPLTRPCFSSMGRSVGKLFFYNFSNSIPIIYLIVSSPNIGNKRTSQY